MGGEKSSHASGCPCGVGSPPHGRGKGLLAVEAGDTVGITPAWAGKRVRRRRKYPCYRDHPRVGGEKPTSKLQSVYRKGSPPHGRGKVANANQASVPHGITPAWAGKRPAGPCGRRRSWDHPRIGGEKGTGQIAVRSIAGSPPHRRGKGVAVAGVPVAGGITPAQAGKSPSCPTHSAARRDHPRMGGEKEPYSVFRLSQQGSPPHRRGKVSVMLSIPAHIGITPAWAGKSPASQPWSPPLWMMVIRPRP